MGYFRFDYGRMDLLGTPDSPVLVCYSAGGLSASVQPTNLSQDALAREAAVPSFDLRWEGNDPNLSTPVNQPDPNRGKLDMVNQLPPALALTKSASTTTAEVGLPFTYTLSILNPGLPATGVTISETLPLSTTFVTADQSGTATATGIQWSGLSVPNYGFLDVTWSIIPGCDTAGKNIVALGTIVTSTQNSTPSVSNSVVVQGVS